MRFFVKSILLFTLIIATAQPAWSQRIKASVDLKAEKLHQDRRLDLQDLDRLIKDYIENNDWTDTGDETEEITVSITIAIDNVASTFEEVYSARFHVFSTTGYQEVDKEWRFAYKRNQPMIFDYNMFDSLTGLIDFYMYIIVAEELDKYGQYLGDKYFRRAQQICQLGKSDRYNRWWDKRDIYVQRYLRESHKPFRDMTSWFYAANYWLNEGDMDEAKAAAEETLKLLNIVYNNTYEQEFRVDFFRREYKNVAKVFSQFGNLIDRIIEIDPERKDYYLGFKQGG